MPSPTGTPLRVVGVLAGLAVAAAATVGVAYLVREGAPGTGAIPAPGTGSPSLSPSASPSAVEAGASPSPTTPEELKARNIAEAKERLVEYYATTAEVANGGYKDWEEKLFPFWGNPTIWEPFSRTYLRLEAEGQYTVGAASVASANVTDYLASDESLEDVHLDACIDFSNVQTFNADGTPIPRDAAVPLRFKATYLMRHQGDGAIWTINEEVRRVEEPC